MTIDILKTNVPGITDEQAAAIMTLVKNNENEVIAAKVADIAANIEKDVLESTGIEKVQGEKYYDYLKRAGKHLKELTGTNTGELSKLKKELDEAKTQLKDNAGDKALKAEVDNLQKALNDEKARIAELRALSKKAEEEHKAALAAEQQKLFDMRIDSEANAALAGMKFKPDDIIPATLRQIAINAAKIAIKQNKPDWIDDGQGGQRLVFRNEAGQIMNNPNNSLNPYTIGELLEKQLEAILDKGKQQTGAGTHSGNGQAGKGASGASFDLSGARSRSEADDLFTKAWFASGRTKSDPDYSKEWSKSMATLPKDLPLR